MVQALEEIIAKSSSIVFFGGAGVSTESGIPDFRSVDGLYHQKYDYPPETILSHTFTNMLVSATLGTMFSGNWGDDGVKLFGDKGTFSALYRIGHKVDNDYQNFGNKIMTTLGLAASVYTLGTTSVKSYAGAQKIITIVPGKDNF